MKGIVVKLDRGFPLVRLVDGTEIRCVGRVLCAVSQAMRPDRQHAEMLSSLFAAGEFA